jgi:hypothetical protein
MSKLFQNTNDPVLFWLDTDLRKSEISGCPQITNTF